MYGESLRAASAGKLGSGKHAFAQAELSAPQRSWRGIVNGAPINIGFDFAANSFMHCMQAKYGRTGLQRQASERTMHAFAAGSCALRNKMVVKSQLLAIHFALVLAPARERPFWPLARTLSVPFAGQTNRSTQINWLLMCRKSVADRDRFELLHARRAKAKATSASTDMTTVMPCVIQVASIFNCPKTFTFPHSILLIGICLTYALIA